LPAIELITLALVQGITEFLPISSSGHLILVRDLFGWSQGPNAELILDVAVHVGTLGAVVLYFWRDVWRMTVGAIRLLTGRVDGDGRLALHIVVATIPVVIVGAIVNALGPDALRTPEIIGWTTLGYGIVLYGVDRACLTLRDMSHLTMGHAIIIGLAQVLALVPGTSRSGITMTAARALGYDRGEAARFSMLMSIPVIVAAGALQGLDLYALDDTGLAGDVAAAALMALVAAFLAIGLLMRWLRHASFTPFVIYRLVLGIAILGLVYGGFFASA